MGTIEKLMQIIDYAWEDLIYDRCSELETLLEVRNVDGKWLKYLKPIFGFTSDLSFDATVAELRRILIKAPDLWNDKPAEVALNDAIRMVTNTKFRIANYFDFRMQLEATCITEELEDFDPYATDFPSNIAEGSNMEFGVFYGYGSGSFKINDLPASLLPTGVFEQPNQFGYLVITEDTAQPTNVGIYEIDHLDIATTIGYIKPLGGAFPVEHSGTVKWKLIGYMDEFITEVRVVDPGTGQLSYDAKTAAFTVGETIVGGTTGARAVVESDTAAGTDGTLTIREATGRFVDNETLTGLTSGAAIVKGVPTYALNRTLLKFLLALPKVLTERLDVVYIDFLEQFLELSILDQWAVTPTATSVTVTEVGSAVFVAGARLIDADSRSQYWGDQVVAWKILPGTSTTVIDLTFFVTDESNHYFVRVDYSAKTVRLYRKVATVDTAIGSAVSLPYLKAGIQDVVRVDALAEGSDTRIRVKVNGETQIDTKDTPASFTAGGVGAYANTSTFTLKLVEVAVLPVEIDRVGPNP